MKKYYFRKKHVANWVVTAVFAVLSFSLSYAQTINVDVEGRNLGVSWSSSCSDCLTGPDYRIFMRADNSATGVFTSDWSYGADNMGCTGWYGINGGAGVKSWSNIASNASVRIQLNGYEDDGGCVAGTAADGNCGGYSGYQASAAATSIAICTWSADQTVQRNGCNSDGTTTNYQGSWRWKWSWNGPSLTNANAGGTVVFSVAADNQMCDGGDPAVFNSSAAGLTGVSYQWQISSDNGTNFSDIAGATSATYDHGVLSVIGGANTFYQFRRKATYCTSSAGGAATTSVFSNALSIEVRPDPNAPTATATPGLNVCAGQTISLTSPAYGSNPGWQCGFEYSIDGGLYGATSSLANPSLGSHTIAIRAIANCKNGCAVSPATTYTFSVVADPTVSISGQGDVCVGGSVNLLATPAAGVGTYNYTWKRGATTVGTNAATYATDNTLAAGNYSYTVDINNTLGCNATSPAVSANVVADPTAPTNTPTPAAGLTVCVGEVLSVTASGSTGGTGTCNYEYAIDAGTGTFGGWSSTNSVTASSVGNGTYRIKSRRNCSGTGCDISPETTTSWTVVADPTAPALNVATPSSGTTVCVGATVSATVNAGSGGTGCTDELRYSADGGSSWSTYTSGSSITAAGIGTNYIQIQSRRNCTGNSCDGAAETFATIAQWTVVADPIAPTLNVATPSSGATVCVGATVSATINAGSGGAGCTDELRYSNDGGGTWSTYTSGNSITASSAGSNRILIQSRRDCSGTGCDGAAETFATIAQWSVAADPSIGTQPVSSAICTGGSASFSVAASGGTPALDYAWQYFDGGSWVTPANGTPAGAVYGGVSTNNMSVTGVTAVSSTDYRCVISATGSDCNSVTSNVVTLSVSNQPNAPTATKLPNTAAVCEGATVTLSGVTDNGGGSGTCGIEYRYNTGSGWSSWSASLPSFAAVAGTNYIEVRRICSNNGCSPAVNSYSWLVNQAPTVANAGTDITLCNTSTFTLAGNNPSVGSGNWTIQSGVGTVVTPAAYNSNVTGVTAGISTTVRWTITNGVCPPSFDEVIITNRALPTATGVAVPSDVCAGSPATVTVIGLLASQTFTIDYTIDGVAQTAATVSSNGSGVGTFNTRTLTSADNGKTLAVTAVSYSTAPSCTQNPTPSTTLTVRSSGTSVILVPSGINVTGAVAQCTESDGWTYYAAASAPNNYIFAIAWNGNSDITTATVDVNTGSIISDEKVRGGNSKDGSFVMGRFWNVNNASSTYTVPVSIRFYYTPSDLTAVETARNNAMNAWNATNPPKRAFATPSSWFKTVGVPFAGGLINDGNNFAFDHVLLAPSASGTQNGVNYVEFNNITSFSGGGFGAGYSPGSGAPLPVTYLSFRATAVENSYIRLDWTTASERDNKGFVVERSVDGRTWSNIGWVDGNGTTTTAMNYVFNDNQVAPNVVYYYRLRQTDYNGTEELSNIVSASIITDAKFVISEFIPNKVETTSELQIFTSAERGVKVEIYNSLGQKVTTVERALTAGNNVIKFDFSNLASGTYSASVISQGEFVGRKFVVVK